LKILITNIVAVMILSIVFTACKKENQNHTQMASSDTELKSSSTKGAIATEIGIVYGNWSCKTPGGETGCECTTSYNEDDCSLLQECTASSSISLPNYHQALNAMFTPAQITARCINNVRITEPALKQALIQDGFPLKP